MFSAWIVALTTMPGYVSASETLTTNRIPTVTRLVQVFFDFENRLLAALAQRDRFAVNALLVEDFEMRTAAAPADPTPRADWIENSLMAPKRTSNIEQMAVHDYGDVAVVSFVWTTQSVAKKSDAKRFFVADVWKRSAETWLLATRYLADQSSRKMAFPGAGAVVEKKF